MLDHTTSSSSPGFAPYRRRQALAQITEQPQQHCSTPIDSTSIGRRVDVAGLNAAMHRLAASPDPLVVFNQLAELLVPVVCDTAAVTVYTGDEVLRWRECPPLNADVPVIETDGDARLWSFTVHTPSEPGHGGGNNGAADTGAADSPELEYVAALTCSGLGTPPTTGDVALIKLAGRCAAGAVRQARATDTVQAQQHQIEQLKIALDSNRIIGAAVGILMSRLQLPYREAFDVLSNTSQNENVKLRVVAEAVLYSGTLPPARSRKHSAMSVNHA